MAKTGYRLPWTGYLYAEGPGEVIATVRSISAVYGIPLKIEKWDVTVYSEHENGVPEWEFVVMFRDVGEMWAFEQRWNA